MSIIATLTNKGYRVKKTDLDSKTINDVKTELTVAPKNEESADEKSYSLYTEDSKYLYMPRFYAQKKFGKYRKIMGLKPQKVEMEFKGDLREKQKPIVDKCLPLIKKNGGGLLSIPCGGGKTVLSLYLASKLGYKTLVLVHKTFLQDQWIERIKQFLPNASVGIIRQNRVDVEGKDIVIGMIQSISMKDYDKSIFKHFNFLIIDECHHIIARVFCRALQKIATKYVLALSATPKRKDGLTYALHWFVGDTIYKGKQAPNTKVCVRAFTYTSNTKTGYFKEKKKWINGKSRPHTVIMTTNLTLIKKRNIFIASVIDILRQQPNRKILVLSHRITHLTLLKNTMDKVIKRNEDEGILEKGECKTGFYIGKMKGIQLKETENADIIYGSVAMAEEGLDIPSLNTIILATPKKEIEQAIGRILRKRAKDMLVPPLIIDIKDDLSVFSNWGNKRKYYYRKNKYNVESHYVKNYKIVSEQEYKEKDFSGDSSVFEESETEIRTLKDILTIDMDKLDDCSDNVMVPNFQNYSFSK